MNWALSCVTEVLWHSRCGLPNCKVHLSSLWHALHWKFSELKYQNYIDYHPLQSLLVPCRTKTFANVFDFCDWHYCTSFCSGRCSNFISVLTCTIRGLPLLLWVSTWYQFYTQMDNQNNIGNSGIIGSQGRLELLEQDGVPQHQTKRIWRMFGKALALRWTSNGWWWY